MALEIVNAGIAQLAEQLICNQQVAGSSPIASSKGAKFERNRTYFFVQNFIRLKLTPFDPSFLASTMANTMAVNFTCNINFVLINNYLIRFKNKKLMSAIIIESEESGKPCGVKTSMFIA